MRNAVIYWSATGSCRAAADALQQSLGENTIMVDLNNEIFTPVKCDHAVVIMPVHAQDIPVDAAGKLERLELMASNASAVAIFGGVHPGAAITRIASVLQKRRIPLTGAAELSVRHSYLRNLSSDITIPPEIAAQLAEMVRSARQREKPLSYTGRRQLLALLPKPLLCHAAMKMPTRSKALCVGCKSCIEACPVGAVLDDMTIDDRRCIRCFACARVCGTKARAVQFTNVLTRWYISRKRNLPELVIYSD